MSDRPIVFGPSDVSKSAALDARDLPVEVVRAGMQIIRDGISLCQDCAIAACNGDLTGLDNLSREEADKREREITTGLESLGPHLVPTFDSETGKGYDEFKRSPCDCCKSKLHGARYDFAILGNG